MSLVKPIINEITAFDATLNATITFIASGGDQVTKNEIKVVYNEYEQGYFNSQDNLFYKESTFQTPIAGNNYTIYVDSNTSKSYIYNGSIFVETNLTEIVAYQNTTTTFNLSHIIPANTLTNGRYYKVAIRTYDALNNVSDWSNYQPFYCYTTPTLTLNVTNGQTITVSSFSIVLTYNQLQHEKLDYAIIELYNTNKVLLSSSGNMYNTDYPPLTFTYGVFGLENHSQYYIKASTVTLNGTITQTDMIRFYTNYDISPQQVTLEATLDSCNGYVNLKSSEVFNIVGESNPDPLKYLLGQQADLRNATADINIEEYAYWAKWNHDLFVIPEDFLLRMWFYPARQPFEIIKLSNDDDTTYLTISQERDNTQDYLSIRTDSGTVKDLALGDFCNGNTKLFLWIKVTGSTWDIQFGVLDTTATVINWNSRLSCTIAYNVTSDIPWGTSIGVEPYGTFIPSSDTFQPMSGETTKILIGNGIFDHLNITKDTTISYTTALPTWDDNSIVDISFNGNLNATPHNYNKLVLKRKDATLLNWMNLSEVDVLDNVRTYIDFNDSFIPTGITQDYALVLYENNVPSEYHTVDITPIWGKYFLSDKDTRFVLNYAVIYSNHVQNIQNGTFMPIGATYPIIVQNGEGNFRSGSLQFKVLGYQFEIDKRLDRVSITRQTQDILKFLTNGKAKCLTDFNGNIYILKVVNSPQISYDANWGNGIATISFDWVEQGKYNDYESMLELGLFDQITTD